MAGVGILLERNELVEAVSITISRCRCDIRSCFGKAMIINNRICMLTNNMAVCVQVATTTPPSELSNTKSFL